jgi:hypothetical protein
MAEARSKVSLIDDPRPLANKAHVIWCVLQCHTIMRSFVSLWFQGHPIIVKEITMFMVTEWVDPSELVILLKGSGGGCRSDLQGHQGSA